MFNVHFKKTVEKMIGQPGQSPAVGVYSFQLEFPFVGERRTPFSFLETTEGCPIPPGASRYIVRNLLITLYEHFKMISLLLPFLRHHVGTDLQFGC